VVYACNTSILEAEAAGKKKGGDRREKGREMRRR
jgi:hypothetical protein